MCGSNALFLCWSSEENVNDLHRLYLLFDIFVQRSYHLFVHCSAFFNRSVSVISFVSNSQPQVRGISLVTSLNLYGFGMILKT